MASSVRLQLFGRDKTLRRSLFLASPLSAVCFLNDTGDILIVGAFRTLKILQN